MWEVMKIDISFLEINVEKELFNNEQKGLWEVYRFKAILEGKEIGHITIDKVVKVYDKSLSKEKYYFDLKSKPKKSIPYLFAMSVEEEYQRKGIASKLIECANAYFKKNEGIPLYSGTLNRKETSEKVWNKFVREGKAIQTKYKKEKRWIML
jgi:GNAT superfamily N-acetyltransferase